MFRRRSIVTLLAGLLAWGIVVLSQIPALSQLSPVRTSELRGVWITNIDSEVMFSREGIDRALQQLAQLNFNTIYPTVWNWGYTLYPSSVAEQAIGYAVDPTIPNFQELDALAAFVDQGHRSGFAVIPWFEFGFMTTAESELASLHPDWITQQQDGTEIWQEGIYERKWLNPFKPEVQQFIQSLILEIVNRYNIDGIQFDDHFGLPAEFGYDRFTVQLYRQEHNGQPPPTNFDDPAWIRWRADKITSFITQVCTAIKAAKPNLIISLAPNKYAYAYQHFLQDWHTWIQRGLVKELLVQIYRREVDAFAAELALPENQEARQQVTTGIGVLTGLKDYPVPIRSVRDQVQMVRDRQFSGVSFFFYETLWNLTNEQESDRQAVLRSLFPAPAARPGRGAS